MSLQSSAAGAPVALSNRQPAAQIARVEGLLVVLTAALGLLGWACDVAALRSVLPGLAQMKVNTALCLLCYGASLVLLAPARGAMPGPLRAGAVNVMVPAAGAIAVATLLQYALDIDLGIDQLLFRDDTTEVLPGRPSAATGAMLALLGLSLWLMRGGARAVAWAQILAAVAGAMALIALFGYLYGVASLYAVGPYRAIAMHTAAAELVLALGILCLKPGVMPMAVFFRGTPSSRLARRILAAAFVIVPLLGLLRLAGQHAGYYGTEFGLALMISVLLIVLSLVIWNSTRLAGDAEEEVARANRLYVALSATNQAIVHAAGRDELLDAVCRAAVDRGGFAMAWVGMTDADSGGIDRIFRAASAGTPPGFVEAVLGFIRADPLTRERARASVEQGRTVVVNRAAGLAPGPRRDHLLAHGLNGLINLPIASDGRLRGIFCVYAREEDFFQPAELSLLAEMAGDISFALKRLASEESRRAAEAEVLRLNAELERRVAERTAELNAANEELAAFNYSVSHDLRAPLRHVRGFLGMGLEDAGASLPAETRELFQRADAAAGRMDVLVGSMLTLSRASEASFRAAGVDLSGMVFAILHELSEGEPARKVETVVAPGLNVTGDPNLLRIALDNLLGNAWKYSGKRAAARIEFGSVETSPGQTAFFVRDNGAGFDTAYAQRLFMPFQRMHGAEFPGTGIGLAIVKRVIERHRGRVWVEARVDQGATFYFTIGVPME